MSSPAATTAQQLPQLSARIHHLPGASRQSQQTTHALVAEVHSSYHIFEANNIFHNHASHHLLTAFALGASPALLDRIFSDEKQRLVPLDPVARQDVLAKTGKQVRTDVPALTAENWTHFVGVQDAYSRYLTFFAQELEQRGAQATLDRYLFSEAANPGGDENKRGPRMLIRLVGGVVHPFIQVGFGAEFGLQTVVAEGLAEAAVHSADTSGGLFPASWPHPPADSVLGGLRQEGGAADGAQVTALEVYRRFVDDPDVVMKAYDPDKMITTRLKEAHQSGNAARMQALAASWLASAPSAAAAEDDGQGPSQSDLWVDQKVAEVQVLNAFLACATGRLGKETRIDFFLMHLLTSSLFLPSILPLLPSFAHRKALLETYFLTVLHTALSRGRPTLDARIPLSWPAHPVGSANPDGNAWAEIVQRTLGHPDSHTIKTVRALLHLATEHAFADSLPGAVGADGGETFPGLAQVDGEVFVRMAGEVGRYMGWSDESDEGAGWDRTALGWDAAWE